MKISRFLVWWFVSLCFQWEKLQKHSEEVRERAETAECQIAAISQEYRKLLQEKDVRPRTASLHEAECEIFHPV